MTYDGVLENATICDNYGPVNELDLRDFRDCGRLRLDVRSTRPSDEKAPTTGRPCTKYSFPRSDLQITVDGTPIKPALALGGLDRISAAGNRGHVHGRSGAVGYRDQSSHEALIDDGVEISAIHNHLLRTSSPVFYMHVGGSGDPVKFAKTLNAALA